LKIRSESGAARVQLIKQANESIDIAYHTLSEGTYSDYFFKTLIEAADRGVKVQTIWDGLIGGMRGNIRNALASHENIELYLFEPLNLFKPWTIHHRLHDKILLADGKYLITGGRNIADKLYDPPGYLREIVYDRDILILRSGQRSVLDEVKSYYNELIAFNGTKRIKKRNSKVLQEYRSRQIGYETVMLYRTNPDILDPSRMHKAFITLVTNPIKRGSNEPWIWDAINSIGSNAEKRVLFQSPYLIPRLSQIKDMEKWKIKPEFLTNSISTTPNIPGFSAYLRVRTKLRSIFDIDEYMGPGSIHAKTILVDDGLSIIGSFNLDPRSTHLDRESMYVISSPGFNSQMNQILSYYRDTNMKVKEASFLKTALFTIASIILLPFKLLV
jgi:cardiolipin synthase C